MHRSGGVPAERTTVRPGVWIVACLIAALSFGGCSRDTGALREVRERGELRVATLNGPTTYFLGPEGPEGPEYALAEKFAKSLGVRLTLVVEQDRSGLRRAIAERRADIAAAQLGLSTPWRKVALPSQAYSESPLFWVHERNNRRPRTAADIAGLRAVVLEDSAELAWLEEHRAGDLSKIRYTVVPRNVGREPLELVASKRADVTLMDGREFAAARGLHPAVDVAFALPQRRTLHWMVRRDGRDLLEEVNGFLAGERGQPAAPTLEIEALTKPAALPRANSDQLVDDLEGPLPTLRPHFEEAAALTGLDWRLLAAVGYQESMWDAQAVSPFGAQGLMMLMPRTARSLDVEDPFDARQSILAGARYLAQLRETVPARIREPDRLWMAIASYNMGYGHLEDARVLTARQGGNSDAWIDVRERLTLLSEEFWYLQVKNGYARGFETKMMVDRVQQYYELMSARFPEAAPTTKTATETARQTAEPTRIVAERQEPNR